jgi:uncharacterized membrane protein
LLGLAVGSSACVPNVVIDGRHYPHWVGSISTVACNPSTDGVADSSILLKVIVVDHWNAPLPTASVAVIGSLPENQLPSVEVDQMGTASVQLNPGSYTIDVRLGGFEESQTQVEAKSGEACVVKFSLGFDRSGKPVVK